MAFKNKATAEDKIRALSRYPEVHDKLISGWSVPDIARFIQEECKEMTSLSRKQMEAAVQRFRQNMSPADKAGKLLPAVVQNAAKEIEQGLDELAELERLYGLQLERINRGLEVERAVKLNGNTLGQEFRIAKEIIDASAKLKQSLGLYNNAPREVNVNVNATMTSTHTDITVAQVIENPEKRSKILGLVNKLIAAPGRLESMGATDLPVIDIPTEEELAELEAKELAELEALEAAYDQD